MDDPLSVFVWPLNVGPSARTLPVGVWRLEPSVRKWSAGASAPRTWSTPATEREWRAITQRTVWSH
jgi:hypothetical protein